LIKLFRFGTGAVPNPKATKRIFAPEKKKAHQEEVGQRGFFIQQGQSPLFLNYLRRYCNRSDFERITQTHEHHDHSMSRYRSRNRAKDRFIFYLLFFNGLARHRAVFFLNEKILSLSCLPKKRLKGGYKITH
jgi:hypothetical protein